MIFKKGNDGIRSTGDFKWNFFVCWITVQNGLEGRTYEKEKYEKCFIIASCNWIVSFIDAWLQQKNDERKTDNPGIFMDNESI